MRRFSMQKNILRLSSLLAAAALLAACGGSSGASLSSDDVAVVGNQHITQAQFDALLAQAKLSFKQNGKTFPKQGTTAYQAVKNAGDRPARPAGRARAAAPSSGASRSPTSEVTNRLDAIKKQYFGGSQAKYQAQLKKQQLTDDAGARDDQAAARSRRRSRTRSPAASRCPTPRCTPTTSSTLPSTRSRSRATCATSSSEDQGDSRVRSTASCKNGPTRPGARSRRSTRRIRARRRAAARRLHQGPDGRRVRQGRSSRRRPTRWRRRSTARSTAGSCSSRSAIKPPRDAGEQVAASISRRS